MRTFFLVFTCLASRLTGSLSFLLAAVIMPAIAMSAIVMPAAAMTTDSGSQGQAGNGGPVVVTIRPLYSLVSQLTEGIRTPVLLMKQAQSPHHYNMRPSERRLLADASIIVWLGPQLETHLGKIIEQKNPASVISVIQADNLRLLEKRKKHAHPDERHDEHPAPETGHADPDKTDPHIWLSTHNALAISNYICDRLSAQDPENAERYKNNLQRLTARIRQTADFVKTTLADNDRPFVSFHDAFQYFEDENRLHYIDSINFDDETGSSIKHLRGVIRSIEKYDIQCLVYQEPRPAIVDSLTRQTPVNAVALDPLGLQFDDDKEAWFELMRQLALGFSRCLAPMGSGY